MPLTIQERAAGLGFVGSKVELYKLDLSAQQGPTLYFHPHNQAGYQTITFRGQIYEYWPVQIQDVEITSKLPMPSPKLVTGDFGGRIRGLMNQYGDLVNCVVTRVRLYLENTDGQPEANPYAVYPVDEFAIDDHTRDLDFIGFSLRARSDAKREQVPKLTVLAHICQHDYRHPYTCQHAGDPFALDDTPISWTNDRGLYNHLLSYASGDRARIDVPVENPYPWPAFSIPRFFVAQGSVQPGQNPWFYPALWLADRCGKRLSSCGCRMTILNHSGAPATYTLSTAA